MKTKIIIALLICVFCVSCSGWHSDGWVKQRYYPLNDEHGEYAETKLHADIGYKKTTLYIEPNLVWTKSLTTDNPRTDDRKYLTSYTVGKSAYFSEFPVGLKYQIYKNTSIGLIYLPRRDHTGYPGDSFGGEVEIVLW